MKRNYGIDLFKILAMLAVVAGHIMYWGGVSEACARDSHSVRYVIEQLLVALCVPAVDCFVLATGYIMSRHTFKYSRIFKLWAEIVFYSLCMTLAAAIWCPWVPVTWREWVKAIMPVATNQYWFVTMYVALFFTMPALNHLIKTLPRKQMVSLLVSGFALLSLYPSVTGKDLFILHGGYSYLWFMYLYLVAGFLALEDFPKKWNNWLLIGGVLLPIITFSLQIAASKFHKFTGLPGGAWGMYASPTVFLNAVVLLLFFSRLELKSGWFQRIIVLVGPSVFSVYALHSNSIFRRMCRWNGRFAPLADLSIPMMICGIVFWAVLIFVACIAIDLARKAVLKRIRALIAC